MSIYKYSRLNRENIQSLLENGIYISKLEDLNDPYEYYKIPNKENYRICSLTTSSNAKLMWSHYADGHKGFSILLDISDDLTAENLPRKIEYDSMRTTDFSSAEKVIEALYHKDKKWINEKEQRVVIDVRSYNKNIIKEINNNYYLQAKIKTIYFGCSAHLHKDYLSALIQLKKYNEKNLKNQIKVKKYIASDNKYKFLLDKDFDYLEEIKKHGR